MGEGQDRLEDKTDAWLDRQAGNLADHPRRTIIGWVWRLGAVVGALVIFFSVLGFIAGWFNTGRDIVSPSNVKAQYQYVIEDWQGLQAAAQNSCQAKESAKQGGDPTLIESPSLAYDARYRQIAVDYNRRWANIFEAKLVGPGGYPHTAPSLAQMQKKTC